MKMKCLSGAYAPLKIIPIRLGWILLFVTIMLLVRGECFTQNRWTSINLNGISGDIEFDHTTKTLVNVSNGTISRSSDFGASWLSRPFQYDLGWPFRIWLANRDSFLFTSEDIGVFKTNDGGKTVFPAMNGLKKYWYSYNDQALAGNPFNRNEVWLGFDDLYLTTDLGDTWTMKLEGVSNRKSYGAVALHPLNPSQIGIATQLNSYEIAVSYDKAISWQQLHFQQRGGSRPYAMIITPSGSYYQNGVSSTDSGKTWKLLRHPYDDIINGGDIMKYAFNKFDNNVYTANRYDGLLKIPDGTNRYEPTVLSNYLGTMTPSRGSITLTIDTVTGLIFTSIKDTLYQYDYRDSSFYPISDGLHTMEIRGIHSMNESGDSLIIGSGSGFFKSVDKGKNWRKISSMGSSRGQIISSSPVMRNFVMYTAQGARVDYSIDGGITLKGTADGRAEACIKYDPNDPHYVYGGDLHFWRQRDSAFITAPPKTRVDVEYLYQGAPLFNWYCFNFDRSRSGIVYAGGEINGENYLVRTKIGTGVWERLGEGILTNTPMEIIVHPRDPSKIWVAAQREIHLSNDTGKTWITITDGFEGRNFTCMAIDSTNPDILFVGSRCMSIMDEVADNKRRGGVYQSTNGGYSWKRLSDVGLENWNIRSMLWLQNPNRLLIGTECGMYEYIVPPKTSVEEVRNHAPTLCSLEQNYPNPFSDKTSFRFTIKNDNAAYAEGHNVFFKIFDLLGRSVKDISYEVVRLTDSEYQIELDHAQFPSPGIYFYQVGFLGRDGKLQSATKKMIFEK